MVACSGFQPDQAAAARAALPVRGSILHRASPGVRVQTQLCQADFYPQAPLHLLGMASRSARVGQLVTCRSHDFTQLMQRKKDVAAGLATDGGSRASRPPRELDKKLLAAPVPMPRNVEERIQMLGGVSVLAKSRWVDLTCTSKSMGTSLASHNVEILHEALQLPHSALCFPMAAVSLRWLP